jgi:hypothetical protein
MRYTFNWLARLALRLLNREHAIVLGVEKKYIEFKDK